MRPPANLVSLADARTAKIERAKVCPETVLACKELLDRAEAGELRGLAFITAYWDGRQEPGATGVFTANPVLMMGGVARLARAAGDAAA